MICLGFIRIAKYCCVNLLNVNTKRFPSQRIPPQQVFASNLILAWHQKAIQQVQQPHLHPPISIPTNCSIPFPSWCARSAIVKFYVSMTSDFFPHTRHVKCFPPSSEMGFHANIKVKSFVVLHNSMTAGTLLSCMSFSASFSRIDFESFRTRIAKFNRIHCLGQQKKEKHQECLST